MSDTSGAYTRTLTNDRLLDFSGLASKTDGRTIYTSYTTLDITFPSSIYTVDCHTCPKVEMEDAEKNTAASDLSQVQPEMSPPDTITSPLLTGKKLFLVIMCVDYSNS